MRFEALAWSLLEILAPAFAREARRRLEWITQEWVDLGAWAHDLFVPYLALILGSISGRDAGLLNLPAAAWGPAAIACLLGLAAAYLASRYLPRTPRSHTNALEALRLEPRLALYRASMATWLPDMTLAIAAGGLLAILEWGLACRLWQRRRLADRSLSQLSRILFSGLFFWATRNLWLTALTQASVVLLLDQANRHGQAAETEGGRDRGKESACAARPDDGEELQ